LNSQRLLLYDTEDVSCTLAGHAEDVKAADIPHLDLKKQKNPPARKPDGRGITLNSQRLLLYDTEDVSCTLAGHAEDAHLANLPHLHLKKQNTPPARKPDGRGCYLKSTVTTSSRCGRLFR
jgi:hypothetical protein